MGKSKTLLNKWIKYLVSLTLLFMTGNIEERFLSSKFDKKTSYFADMACYHAIGRCEISVALYWFQKEAVQKVYWIVIWTPSHIWDISGTYQWIMGQDASELKTGYTLFNTGYRHISWDNKWHQMGQWTPRFYDSWRGKSKDLWLAIGQTTSYW